MTETTPSDPIKIHPSEVLMRVIIALLTPAFLSACGGDATIARLAALETIKQHNPRNHVDLIVIAQIIACGLASAASASMSLRTDFSASMALRLRANAATLSRVAERASRALAEPPKPAVPEPRAPEPIRDDELTKLLSDLDAPRALINQARAEMTAAESQAAQPKAAQSKAARSKAAQAQAAPVQTPVPEQILADPFLDPNRDPRWDAMWAGAMNQFAEEVTADLDNIPPEEREEAIRHAARLTKTAAQLLANQPPPNVRQGAPNPKT